ncbi:hypothetical protein FOL47_009245 [Perkinsus chesapeaki]|uniref:Choline transporter-like protein n=1 Tax=Perkinsus chesapeaki TaxID=330153 RepID=A0A7J6L9K5_PERCH|nr:hypothetical protein FOL47_009245 [Perkinsus chesapeaki]
MLLPTESSPPASHGFIGDMERQAGMKNRRCTDVAFVILGLVFLGGLGIIWQYAASHGDLRRITHGFNYKGELCGADASVLEKPFLYWCAGIEDMSHTPVAMNFANPICVERCPTEKDPLGDLPCPMPAMVDTVSNGDAPYDKKATVLTQEIVPQPGIPTISVAGRYCLPNSTFLAKQIMRGPISSQAQQMLFYAAELGNASKAIITGLLVALVASFSYIILLKNNAMAVANVSLAASAVAFLTFGASCYTRPTVEVSPIATLFVDVAQSDIMILTRIVGVLSFAVAITFMIIACKAQSSIRLGSAYVKEACAVMLDLPALALYPLLDIAIKVTAIAMLGYGFMYLISAGSITGEKAVIDDHEIAGVHRNFAYSDKEIWMMVYWLFGIWLVWECLSALSYFTTSYSTILYYFATRDLSGERQTDFLNRLETNAAPWFTTYHGLVNGLVYHTGTIILGSLLTMFLRPLRLVLDLIDTSLDTPTSTMSTVLAKGLTCCLTTHRKIIRFLREDAYISVAFNSSPFLSAGTNAYKVLHADPSAISSLPKTIVRQIFQLVGVAIATAFSGHVTHMIITCREDMMDTSNKAFVSATSRLKRSAQCDGIAKCR